MEKKLLSRLAFSICTVLIYALYVCNATAGEKHRFQIILDGSLTMSQSWDSTNKFKAASAFIAAFSDSTYTIDSAIEVGVRVFGHQYSPAQGNCYDTRQEVFFTKDNRQQIQMRLNSIYPKGIGSAVYSLREAIRNNNKKDGYSYHYIMVTDVSESCGANFCSAFANMPEYRDLDIHLIQFSDKKAEQFKCLEKYINLVTKKDANTTITTILNPFRKKTYFPSDATNLRLLGDTSSGSGYLLFTAIKGIKIDQLLHKKLNQYLPFTEVNIANLIKGQRTKIKKGSYRIEYKNALDQILTRDFEIKEGMITEVQLN